MHPVRRAFNTWKRQRGGGTMREFAEYLGYADADTVYRIMRGPFIPPVPRVRRCAEILNWTVGRFINACVRANEEQQAS